MLDLEAIKKRAEAANKGPWTWGDYPDIDNRPCPSLVGAHGYGVLSCDGEANGPTEANAAFIAHAREDVPGLVAEVERLRAAIRALGDHVYTLQDGLKWLEEECNSNTGEAGHVLCCLVSMVSREGPKGLPGRVTP